LWSGSITFGLLNAPVRIYTAVTEHKLHFHYLHEKDDSPIGYEKVCKKEGKPVPDDEIVKAFEYAKGKYVYMEEEDFAAAKVEGHKTIDVEAFVRYEEIDPIYFAKTYYVGPEQGAERVYALLARAMNESGLAALTKFVMRDRQHLGLLRVRNGVITLEQLYFADEIRPIDEIKPEKASVKKEELAMASRLIESYTTDWDPQKYKDTYRDELMAVIEAKRKGKQIHAAAEVEEASELPDLMTALRESVERAGHGRRRTTRKSATSSRVRKARSTSKSTRTKRAA
jgi:DNA end-binding protein Ku